MNIIVTGGAGFIGQHLVKRLLDDGHYVVVVDDLSTGSEENLDPRAHFIHYDVRVQMSRLRLPKTIDQIYHLACPASPVAYQMDPSKTVTTAVLGTHQMIEWARILNARLLLASTSEVYGQPIEHPQRELTLSVFNLFGPRACYDVGKAAAEVMVRESRIDYRIARIHNTYGPGMALDDGRVVTNFIRQLLNDELITMYGDGKQTRCFCYVDDMVEGLIRLMNFGAPITMNLGATHEISIRELGDAVGRAVGVKVGWAMMSLPEDDPIKRKPNMSRAWEHLGWCATTPLDVGLAKTVEYWRKKLGG